MSWDSLVQDLPRDAATTADIPDDFQPRPLGPRAEIIRKIVEVVPTANFSDLAWGTIDSDGWLIEMSLGKEELCDGFASTSMAAKWRWTSSAILGRLDLRALDAQTAEFFAPGPGSLASFEKRRAYRDRSVGNHE